MTSMRIDGGQMLAKGLMQLSDSVRGKVMRDALKDAAEPMRESMAHLAPREPGKPDLADNIVVSRVTMIGSVDGIDAPERKNDTEEAVAIGPSKKFFYAGFLEWGTAKMSARPFMRPAFDLNVQRSLTILIEAIRRALFERGVSGSRASSTGEGML